MVNILCHPNFVKSCLKTHLSVLFHHYKHVSFSISYKSKRKKKNQLLHCIIIQIQQAAAVNTLHTNESLSMIKC